MNKFLSSLAIVAMLAATPAFAAMPKHVMHRHASHAACIVKGKKTACPVHAMHHHAKKAPVVYKKK